MAEDKPTIYNAPTIYKTGAEGGGGDDDNLPIEGTLNNEWIFDSSDPDRFTDKINSIVAVQFNPSSDDPEGYPYIDYNHGINLNVIAETGDFIEFEFNRFTDTSNGYNRLFTKNNGSSIGEEASFLIGPYSNKWKSYFGGWSSDIADYHFYKKMSIFLKTDSSMNVYFNNNLVCSDFVNNWKSSYSSYNLFSIGCSTTSYTSSSTPTTIKRIRIFKNCTLK